MSTIETNWRQMAACKQRPDLFHAAALDYEPSDPDYADLSPADHRALAAAKADAEQAATDHCFGCPVMQQCDAWALSTGEATGVAGGRTEAERAAILDARDDKVTDRQAVTATTDLTSTIRDRGVRNQIDDSVVEYLTYTCGKDAKYIAEQMQCSERSVVRARRRISDRRDAETATPGAAEVIAATKAAPAHTPNPLAATLAADFEAETTPVLVPAAPARDALAPNNGARDISAAMRSIYATMADGQWHHREDLIDMGVSQVSDADALDWWTRTHTIITAAGEIIDPAKAHLTTGERIARGARDKVSNMLSASARPHRKNTERGGPTGNDRALFRITAKALANGLVTTSALASTQVRIPVAA